VARLAERRTQKQGGDGNVTHGLIYGRFDPPHAGHVLLGHTATELVDHLTILVVAQPGDLTAPSLRRTWLAELFPRAKIVLLEAAAEMPRDVQLAQLICETVPLPIDTLFAGSGKGGEIASLLGARFVELDRGHRIVPVSSAAVRADPLSAWPFLPEPVRPHFARTICLHGPESTGKSTLAPVLARHLDTMYLPEYGRSYCEEFGLELTMADLLTIGQTHAALTRATLRACNKRLILDTDPLMTAAWAEMLFQRSDPWFDAFDETADLYLLLNTDLPWVDDGTRFFGTASRRQMFFDCSRDQLERRGLHYVVISGPPEERFARSVAAIEALG
jgi:HTH-type transcriptional repressor of NAD biosynthesis genes